jgi:hypothetical protein
MAGSNFKIEDFSTNRADIKFDKDEKIIELLERLNTALSNFNIQTPIQEGGNDTSMNFEELLKKYNKTVEDITFEYIGLTDEELTKKFEETFGEETNDDTDGSDGTNPEPSTDNGEETEPDGTSDKGTGEDSGTGDNPDTPDNGEGDGQEQFAKSADGMVKSFEISHEDLRYALYNLLEPFEKSDNTYYWISNVYDTYFVYEDWDGSKIYRQNYAKDGDNVSFDGERIELFKEYLTASEKAELESMRSNYASLVEFKATTEEKELHSKREAVLANPKYSVLATKDEEGKFTNASYATLYSKMDEYSVEDLEKEVKIILGEFALNEGKFSASTEPEQKKTTSMKQFTNPNSPKKKHSRYGNLFNKN